RSKTEKEGLARKKKKAEKRAAGEDLKQKPMKPPFGGRVVVDLGFDEKLTDKEINSLCNQLAETYGANRKAGKPFSLLFTSLTGKTLARLSQVHPYKQWKNTEWWAEDYERLWRDNPAAKHSLVYLTADSDEELTELNPDETYVIGGISDQNECLNKAQASGIRTARFPIPSEHPTRKGLTVKAVFDILLHFVDTHIWEATFHAALVQ
ncbi:guanine-1-methyltransferase-domain-containing protein, partial [Mycena leptocephala]